MPQLTEPWLGKFISKSHSIIVKLIKFNPPFYTAIIWLLFTTTLLCLPGSNLTSNFSIPWLNEIWLDKWAHIGFFSILVFLFCRAINDKSKFFNFVLIAVFALIYGIAIEFIQDFIIPLRSFEFGDIVADSIGCLLGLFIASKKLTANKKPL